MNAILRRFVGIFVTFIAWCTRPDPIRRSEQDRRLLAPELKGLRLYDYRGCPRSLRLRRELHRLNLDLAYCDIQKCQVHQDNMLAQRGCLRAPSLRIEDTQGVRWLDEPEQIIAFLRKRFDPANGTPADRIPGAA